LFVVLAITLVIFIVRTGAFQPSVFFTQPANIGKTLSVTTSVNAIATLTVTPLMIGNQFYQKGGTVTTQRVVDVNGPVLENLRSKWNAEE
jgi:hypothetical protein